jgi:hypothetical protein
MATDKGIEIRMVVYEEREMVVSLLEEGLSNDRIKHRKLFEHGWSKGTPYFGVGLYDKGVIQGFLGCILADKNNLVPYKTCHLATWYVREEYRKHGLKLLYRSMKYKKEYVIINLTPVKSVRRIFEALKFSVLDEKQIIAITVPSLLKIFSSGVAVSRIDSETEKLLTAEDVMIFRDHTSTGVYHVIIQYETEYCYVVFTKRRRVKGMLLAADVQYVSNSDLFVKCLDKFKIFMLKHGIVFVTIDLRFIEGSRGGIGLHLEINYPKYFYSKEAIRGRISNLYSELVL